MVLDSRQIISFYVVCSALVLLVSSIYILEPQERDYLRSAASRGSPSEEELIARFSNCEPNLGDIVSIYHDQPTYICCDHRHLISYYMYMPMAPTFPTQRDFNGII